MRTLSCLSWTFLVTVALMAIAEQTTGIGLKKTDKVTYLPIRVPFPNPLVDIRKLPSVRHTFSSLYGVMCTSSLKEPSPLFCDLKVNLTVWEAL